MALKPCCMASRGTRLVVPLFMTRRLRGVMEFFLVSLIWGVLVALAASAYRGYVEHAYVAEALSHASTIKQELLELHAETGIWPDTVDSTLFMNAERDHRRVRIEYEAGAFTFILGQADAPYRVSIRAAISESEPRAPVQWLCGYEEVPPGYRVNAKNQTDAPMRYLPNACQGPT